jgi:hypothetical protein
MWLPGQRHALVCRACLRGGVKQRAARPASIASCAGAPFKFLSENNTRYFSASDVSSFSILPCRLLTTSGEASTRVVMTRYACVRMKLEVQEEWVGSLRVSSVVGLIVTVCRHRFCAVHNTGSLMLHMRHCKQMVSLSPRRDACLLQHHTARTPYSMWQRRASYATKLPGVLRKTRRRAYTHCFSLWCSRAHPSTISLHTLAQLAIMCATVRTTRRNTYNFVTTKQR